MDTLFGDTGGTDLPAASGADGPHAPAPHQLRVDLQAPDPRLVRVDSPHWSAGDEEARRLRAEYCRAEAAVAAAEERLRRERHIAAQAERLARLEAQRQHLLARRDTLHTLLADVDRPTAIDFGPLNAVARALIAGARARAALGAGADIPVGVARRRQQQAAEALDFATARLRALATARDQLRRRQTTRASEEPAASEDGRSV